MTKDGDDKPKKESLIKRVIAYCGNNAIQIDADYATKGLLEVSSLLLQEGEVVEMAFKMERDDFYFTSKRFLFRDKKGVSGHRVEYTSVPYRAIQGYQITTPGALLDFSSELEIWCSGMETIKMGFAKEKCDIFAVQMYFSRKLLSPGVVDPGQVEVCQPGAEAKASQASCSLFDYLGDNARQVNAPEFEARLKREPAVLEQDEKVLLAFRVNRDCTLFTSKRILIIDVQGFSGKRVAFRSVLWKSIRAFGVESAGGMFDRDAELFVWTAISGYRCIKQDLRKESADLMAVNRFISNMVLGNDSGEAFAPPARTASDSGATSLGEWFGDDHRQVDTKKLDERWHTSPAILQNDEHVEMAFKGRRDMTVFTPKRLIIVDVQGMTGKRVKYISVPWTTVKAFGVRSAGSFMDKDSEMVIYTDIMYDPPKGDDKKPQPGMAMLEQDFSKDKVDLTTIHSYLSARCIRAGQHSATVAAPMPAEIAAGSTSDVESLLNWLGGDAAQIDPAEFQARLSQARWLQEGESVVMAFKVGRDTMAFTDRRFFKVDVQGLSGKRVYYLSIPYTSLRAFTIISGGFIDLDAEVELNVKSYWMPMVSFDLRKGKADLAGINRFLGAQLFGTYDGPGAATPQNPAYTSDAAVSGFMEWLCSDSRAVNAQDVDKRLHTEPAILLDDEVVDTALKCGRDMWVFTNKRVLAIDAHGASGRKVEYNTVPLKYCIGCRVQSAGMLDWDSEGTVFVDACEVSGVYIEMRKEKVDLFALNQNLVAKVLA